MNEMFRIAGTVSLSHALFQSLHMLYAPLVGKEAVCLYDVMVALDHRNTLDQIDHLQRTAALTPTRFEHARKQLEQYGLLETFRNRDHAWLFVLHEPKKPVEFLSHDVYSRLYLQKEGSVQMDRMKLFFSYELPDAKQWQNVSEPLDVSSLEQWNQSQEQALHQTQVRPADYRYPFNFSLVFQGMERVIPQRVRTRENLDRIYDLARIFGADEKSMRRYISLSLNNDKTQIDFELLRNRLLNARKGKINGQDPYSMAPVAFLQHRQKGMPVARSDKELIEQIMLDYQLPGEVMNVLIDYCLDKTEQRFNKAFVEKVASSWARLHVDTKEKAMAQTQEAKKPKTEDVPSWYADTGNTKMNPQTEAEIEDLLEELKGGPREEN